MELNFDQIKEITQGAVRIEEGKRGVHFYRFTNEQEELYKEYNDNFYKKTFSTSGVKLVFKTNSNNLFLKVFTEASSSRSYFAFDILLNGKFIDSLDNYSDKEIADMYPHKEYQLGGFSQKFEFESGEKEITVVFPFSVNAVLEQIIIDDGAYIKPIKREKKILMFGDSITHGYDSLHTSRNYASKLADALGAELINKGIGGERFFPALAKTKDDFRPDYITVAYGTNDWNGIEQRVEFENNCKAFYTALSKNYPDTKIFAITPIWRKDYLNEKPVGRFESVREYIENMTTQLDNVICISGFELVPHDEKYFGDLYLHPNEEGFKYYFENLYKIIKEFI